MPCQFPTRSPGSLACFVPTIEASSASSICRITTSPAAVENASSPSLIAAATSAIATVASNGRPASSAAASGVVIFTTGTFLDTVIPLLVQVSWRTPEPCQQRHGPGRDHHLTSTEPGTTSRVGFRRFDHYRVRRPALRRPDRTLHRHHHPTVKSESRQTTTNRLQRHRRQTIRQLCARVGLLFARRFLLWVCQWCRVGRYRVSSGEFRAHLDGFDGSGRGCVDGDAEGEYEEAGDEEPP